MKILYITYFPALFICLIISSCSDRKPSASSTETESKNIRSYLLNAAKEITDNSINGIRSLENWEKIKASRHSEFIEMLGMQDMPLNSERCDLNVKITGRIQRDGYHIEKLYYESLPGLYVPANLYVPDNIKEPVPAVLYLCGHAPTQKVHYQTHPAKFA